MDTIDKHLDAVLRASGSALRHYTTQKSLCEMREAMRTALADGVERHHAEVMAHQETRAALRVVVDSMLPMNLRTPGAMAGLDAPWPQVALALWAGS